MNPIGVVVSDMDATIAFCGKLGLAFTVDARMADHASCDLPNGRHLMPDTETFLSTDTPGGQRGVGSPPGFLAFQVLTPAEVDATSPNRPARAIAGCREPWERVLRHARPPPAAQPRARARPPGCARWRAWPGSARPR
jgi:hypothetical protein